MIVLDPFTHRSVDLRDCVVLDPIDERLCPVRLPGGEWMLVDHVVGRLQRFDAAPASKASVGRLRSDCYSLGEAIASRVEAMRLLEEGTALLPDLDGVHREWGAVPTRRAIVDALAAGYGEDEVNHALATLREGIRPEDVPEDPLDEGVQDEHILKAIFMAGAGGSGKSFIAGEAFAGEGLKFINADKHLERLLKAHEVPLDKAGSRYDLFRQARDLKTKEQTLYSGRRLGLVIDTTGWEYSRVADPVDRLEDLGYDTYMIFVSTSLETALRRNEERGASGGRRVPDSFIRDAWEGAHDNIGRYRKLFGKNFFLIDNDSDLPPKQAEKVLLPAVRRIANRILRAPVKNPKGKKWIEAGGVPEKFPPPEPKKPKTDSGPTGKKHSLPGKSYTAPAPKNPKDPDALKKALASHNTKFKQTKLDLTFPKGKPSFEY